MRKILFCVLLIVFLISCASIPPSPEEIQNAHYGRYPSHYQEIAKAFIHDMLIDPESARFSGWRGPSKGWYQGFMSSKTYYGYQVCVSVNAKNRLGGYTGRKLFYLLINDGRVIAFDGGDYKIGTLGEERIYKLCAGV